MTHMLGLFENFDSFDDRLILDFFRTIWAFFHYPTLPKKEKPLSKANGYGCVVILLKAVRTDPNSLRVLIRFPASL